MRHVEKKEEPMTNKILLTVSFFLIFSIGFSSIKNNNSNKSYMEKNNQLPLEESTSFSAPETIVLQILTDVRIGKTTVNGKEAYNTCGYVFIPKPDNPGYYISCPLKYFQQSVSLPEKWILDDSGNKIHLNNTDKFTKVIITKKINGKEEIIDLPEEYSGRIMNYFNLDIPHNDQKYKGFDCYAFASLIVNVKYYPLSPDFEYQDKLPKTGDVVVLANGTDLPESIMHWAIFLGDNQYLSKFGRSGEGAESLLTIMDLEGMKMLYNCKLKYVALPKAKAKKWEGYKL